MNLDNLKYEKLHYLSWLSGMEYIYCDYNFTSFVSGTQDGEILEYHFINYCYYKNNVDIQYEVKII